jgi:predicted RNA polymerase sigma factor
MAQGPTAGLTLLDGLDEQLGDHHRLHAVRGHLLEMAGDTQAAMAEFRTSAALTSNLRERHYLTTEAARLATGVAED